MYNLFCESDLCPNELIPLFCTQGISVRHPIEYQGGSRFRMEKEQFSLAEKALSGRGKIVILTDNSLAGVLERCGARAGFFCGLVLFICALTVYSLAVTRLEIYGNEYVSEELISKKVSNIITFPSSKQSIDREKIALGVMETEGIALAKAEICGNVLRVTVTEELPSSPSLAGDIVAEEDGIVEKIVTGKGTCTVRVGESVHKGQVLIQDDGEGASGEVVYRVYLSKRYIYGEKEIQKVRTGRTLVQYTLPGTAPKRKTDFALYEKEETNEWFSPLCPLYVRKVTFYEVEEREITVDGEKRKQEILKRDQERTERELPQHFRKIKSWFFVKTVDKNTILDIYYEVVATTGR